MQASHTLDCDPYSLSRFEPLAWRRDTWVKAGFEFINVNMTELRLIFPNPLFGDESFTFVVSPVHIRANLTDAEIGMVTAISKS